MSSCENLPTLVCHTLHKVFPSYTQYHNTYSCNIPYLYFRLFQTVFYILAYCRQNKLCLDSFYMTQALIQYTTFLQCE